MRQLTKEVLKVKKKQRNKDKTKNQVKSQINYTANIPREEQRIKTHKIRRKSVNPKDMI